MSLPNNSKSSSILTDAPIAVEKTVNINGMTFALKVWGDENAPPILALHGWLDNAASYNLLAPLLKEFCVYAMDLAGHGKSDHRPEGVPYHFVDYVADGFYVASALGLDRFHLMGHSLGANVAGAMAGTIPERILSLSLIEGFGPATRAVDQTASLLRESIEKFLDQGSAKKRYAEFESLVKARINGRWPLTYEAARFLCERGSVELDGKFTWSSDPRINYTSPLRMSPDQATAIREGVTSPCKIVLAEQGIAPMLDAAKPPLSEFKTSSVYRMTGFHHVHMEAEHVEMLAEVLNLFLLENEASLNAN